MDQILSSSNLSVEERVILPSAPTFTSAVQMVRQSTYEFRKVHANPHDPELPVVFAYDTPTEQVDIISKQPLHIMLQVQPRDINTRVSYECDPAQEYAAIVCSYDKEQVINRLGILPSQEGIDTLLQISRQIRHACHTSSGGIT